MALSSTEPAVPENCTGRNWTVSPSPAVQTSTESKRKLGIVLQYLVFKTLHTAIPWEVVEGRQQKPNSDCWDIFISTPLTLCYMWHEPFSWQPQLYKIWPGQGNTQVWHLLAHDSLSQKTTSFWHESKYCSDSSTHCEIVSGKRGLFMACCLLTEEQQ